MAAALILPAGAHASDLYVSNFSANTVSPFSIAASGSLNPIACSGAACATGTGPQGVAVTPNGRFLYAANSGSTAVSPFAIGAAGTLSSVACSGSNCNAGMGQRGVAVSPNGRFLYVANFSSNTVSPFTINADGSLTPITCSGCSGLSGPYGVAVSPNGRFVYVTNSGSGSVSPFAINADGSLTPITCSGSACSTGSFPKGVAVSPNGKFLYVAREVGSGTVVPFAINADGSLTPITCSGCATGANPYAVAVSPDGQFAYAVNFVSDTVSPFSIQADGSLTPITCSAPNCNTGSSPRSVAVSPSGKFLYVPNSDSGMVSPVSPFSIGASGSLSPVACPGTNCNAGAGPEWVAISPDQAPAAAFSQTLAPSGQPSSFNGSASSAAPGQTVARYDWSFGDGQSVPNAGATPTHVYSVPGTYTVTLTVTDDAGCSTRQTFTGQTASCNGGPQATATRQISIAKLLPPRVKITQAKISAKHRKASFRFTAMGSASGFQCALVRKAAKVHHHKKPHPHFKGCKSPKTYKHLKSGTYTFYVRAFNSAGRGTPSKKGFKIR